MTRGRSSLALFGSRLVSSEGRRATDITLDGHDPVLPGAASVFLLGQVDPSDPIKSCNPLLYGHDPDGIDSRGFGFVFRDFPSSYWAI